MESRILFENHIRIRLDPYPVDRPLKAIKKKLVDMIEGSFETYTVYSGVYYEEQKKSYLYLRVGLELTPDVLRKRN